MSSCIHTLTWFCSFLWHKIYVFLLISAISKTLSQQITDSCLSPVGHISHYYYHHYYIREWAIFSRKNRGLSVRWSDDHYHHYHQCHCDVYQLPCSESLKQDVRHLLKHQLIAILGFLKCTQPIEHNTPLVNFRWLVATTLVTLVICTAAIK